MGIWSQCIYVDKPDLKFDIKLIPDNIVKRLNYHGFFTNYLDNKSPDKSSIISLKEFSEECRDTAKIYGYLDDKLRSIWSEFILNVASQNSDCDYFEIHFYCSDENIPYYFYYNKNDKYDEVNLRIYKPNNVLYTNIIYNKSTCSDIEEIEIDSVDKLNKIKVLDDNNYLTFQFDIDRYIKFYKYNDFSLRETMTKHIINKYQFPYF